MVLSSLSFNQRFNGFIAQHKLLQKSDKIIAAVSGGMDSMVLCDLLYKNKYKFVIAHVNFNLRGEESEKDEQFVRELAEKYQSVFHIKRFETRDYASANNISIEMAARELRYNWFYELMVQDNMTRIVTAHHKNDNAETILLNLTRGTGIRGMHGILPISGAVVRPMLFATRQEIEIYASENNIRYRTDQSNSDTDFRRNFIRHEIIPRLKTINPALEETLSLHSNYILEYERFIAGQLDEMKNLLMHFENELVKIDISLLLVLQYKNLILYEILRDFGFNYETVLKITESLTNIPGKRFLSPSHELVKDRKFLIITAITATESKEEVAVSESTSLIQFLQYQFEFRKINNSGDFEDLKDAGVAYLNYSKLVFPLKIRFWQEGDYFIPFGMKTRKKLSDFFIDQKVALNEKSKIPLIESERNIVWIAGFRIDNRYRISEQTAVLYKIKIKN